MLNRNYHVVVTCSEGLVGFPPAVSLVTNLLSIGCRVTLLACGDTECLPESVNNNPNFSFITLGERGGTLLRRGKMLFNVPRTIRSYLKKYQDDIDIVWTTMAIDVRDAGDVLRSFNHVMQMPELTETVPAFLHRNRPPFSRKTIELARLARKVVVPEYNRAFIQQTMWRLPETPTVLPNKPTVKRNTEFDLSSDDNRLDQIKSENRKIILYQGLFADDRNLFPFADAVDSLGGEFVLYLMGKATDAVQQASLEKLLSTHTNVEYLGYIPAPNHLAFTRYARIGLLPYSICYGGDCPPLNALYCAPNKIWEYSCYGVPMLGSDVPGLTGIFGRYNCGLTSSSVPHEISRAICKIDASRDEMSLGALRLFDSIDTKDITERIIEDVLE